MKQDDFLHMRPERLLMIQHESFNEKKSQKGKFIIYQKQIDKW